MAGDKGCQVSKEGDAMSEGTWKPADAAKKLGMPPSTLRVYSTKFAELLSESASNPPVSPDGRTGHRLYSDRDLTILGKAKELLSRGLTYDQALAELRILFPSSRTRAKASAHSEGLGSAALAPGQLEALLAPLMASIQNAQKAAEAWQSVAAERARENDELRERIKTIEARLSRLEERWVELVRRIEEESARQPGLLARILGR